MDSPERSQSTPITFMERQITRDRTEQNRPKSRKALLQGLGGDARYAIPARNEGKGKKGKCSGSAQGKGERGICIEFVTTGH